MRLIPALLCVLLLASIPAFPQDAAPSGSAGTQLRPALPGHVKLLNEFGRPNGGTSFWKGAPRRTVSPPLAQAASAACAHIVMIPAKPGIDPKMAIPSPERSVDNMPVFKGMPACAERPAAAR